MSQGTSRLVGWSAVEEALATLRAKYILVVAITLLGMVAGIALAVGKSAEKHLEMRVRLSPIAANGSVVALGVSAPPGPIAADFISDPVLDPLARTVGRSTEELENELSLENVTGDSQQLIMVVHPDSAEAKRLMAAWYAQVQRNRHAVLRREIEQARQGYVGELGDLEPMQARRDAIENIARLAGLSGSLQSDVSVLRRPKVVEASTRSPLFYVLVGLIGGFFAGAAIALGIGLLQRKLRTPGALAAQFGLPVVADLRGGSGDGASGLAERLKIAAVTGQLTIVEAGDGTAAKAAADALDGTEGIPSLLPVGSIGSAEAQAGVGVGDPWVIAVSPGATRTDQAAEMAAELPGLASRPLGLVLV
jgi:hypothetical protein